MESMAAAAIRSRSSVVFFGAISWDLLKYAGRDFDPSTWDFKDFREKNWDFGKKERYGTILDGFSTNFRIL
jgi:hypothetical protein